MRNQNKKPDLPDLMQIRVQRYVPKAARDEAQNLYISINGRGFNIPRGSQVSIPLPVWERLESMLRAELQVEDDVRQAPTVTLM